MNLACSFTTRLLVVVAIGLALAACHPAPTTTSATSATGPAEAASAANLSTHDTLTHERLELAARPANPIVTTVRPGSFATLMQALPAPQQSRVRDWYERIGAPSMEAATAKQIAWMQARGYPMPADIAGAATMTTAELKTEAALGHPTAQALYLAHLLDQYHDVLAANVPFKNHHRIELVLEIFQAMRRELATGSPYAGYLYAASSRLMYPGNVEHNASARLAGLVWAVKFGDTRAIRELDQPTVQAVDAGTASAAMSLILGKALLANPRLFALPVVPIPDPDS